jgi:hypothetical protein
LIVNPISGLRWTGQLFIKVIINALQRRLTMTKQPAATIGDNKPPETPFEIYTAKINDLYDEAVHWLDGDPVDSEEMAEGIATLLDTIRKAASAADKERGIEKRPHLDANTEIEAKWKGIIGRANLAVDTCKKALAPWLSKKQKEKDEADRLAREKADKEMAEAQQAIRDSEATNLAERAVAEDKLEKAKRLDARAKRDANKGAGIKPKGGGRAVHLRKSFEATLDDPEAALEHFWPHVDIEACLTKLANDEVKRGKREIPGFRVTEKKGAA